MSKLRNHIRVPGADGAANTYMSDVIGNKSDAAAAGGVSTSESLMAYLKQLVGAVPVLVAGTTDTSPLASMDLFSIDSGPVIVDEIFGIVTTTPIQAQATTIQLSLDPDDGGSDVALDAGSYDATGAATGTIIRCTKDFSDALLASLDAHEATTFESGGIIMQPGDIKVTYGAASTGQINWYVLYRSLGGVITAPA